MNKCKYCVGHVPGSIANYPLNDLIFDISISNAYQDKTITTPAHNILYTPLALPQAQHIANGAYSQPLRTR
jgi:hypothetical protein